MDRCPACGDFPDYCQGHGEIGDPFGYSVLVMHDDGTHSFCHYQAECQEEYPYEGPLY